MELTIILSILVVILGCVGYFYITGNINDKYKREHLEEYIGYKIELSSYSQEDYLRRFLELDTAEFLVSSNPWGILESVKKEVHLRNNPEDAMTKYHTEKLEKGL